MILILFTFLLVLQLFFCASAEEGQTPTIPQLWNHSVTLPYQDRLQIARDAVTKSASMLTSDGFVPARDDRSDLDMTFAVYSTLANFDAITKESNFKTMEQNLFSIFLNFTDCPSLQCEGDEVTTQRGYAAIHGYSAYQEQVFLEEAESMWGLASQYTISDANSQLSSLKNFSIVTECEGNTNPGLGGFGSSSSLIKPQGATFKSSNASDTDIKLFTTALSALIAEATNGQNSLYIAAAQLSADFLNDAKSSGLYDGESGPDFDLEDTGTSVREGDRQNCGVGGINYMVSEISVSGLLIEGLSILYSITNNSTYKDRIITEISLYIAHQERGQWSLPSGILQQTCYNSSGDPFILRGLSQAARIEILPSDILEYVKGFIGVQYNAVQAASQSNNIYGCNWNGPPLSSFDFDVTNQTRAAQLLVDGLSLFETQTSSTPIPSPNITSSHIPAEQPKSPKSNTRVIIGATLGGVAVLFLIAVTICCFSHRQRHWSLFSGLADKQVNSTNPNGAMVISPFVHATKATVVRHKGNHHSSESGTVTAQTGDSRQSGVASPSIQSEPSSHSGARESQLLRPTMVPYHNGSEVDRSMVLHPDLVRLLYQRMWQPEINETPPDYQSQQG
ncbi:glycoside hydrolase family 76 protein [Moniliophthora roreri]|nr:glycoside hydrolase family 76 protein [Moniliophthora roreri]